MATGWAEATLAQNAQPGIVARLVESKYQRGGESSMRDDRVEVRLRLSQTKSRIRAGRQGGMLILAGKMMLIPANTDTHAYAEADVAFHLFILDASANPFLQSIGALIRAALAASFAISAPADDDDAENLAQSEHDAVATAIAAGDPQAAADAMMSVILRGWSRIGESSDSVMISVALREFCV